ncbi:hypothetical protein, partial [Haloarcula sp. H-GB5]
KVRGDKDARFTLTSLYLTSILKNVTHSHRTLLAILPAILDDALQEIRGLLPDSLFAVEQVMLLDIVTSRRIGQS